MTRLKGFALGQRVFVHRDCDGLLVEMTGTVVKLRRSDDAAWVALDKRHADDRVHPFAADDPGGRSTHTLVDPEWADGIIDAKVYS